MTDKMREEFEAWHERTLALLVGTKQHAAARKIRNHKDLALLAWEASRAATVVELPPEPIVPDEPVEAIDDSFMDSYYAAQGMRNACAQLITAAGLKVKP